MPLGFVCSSREEDWAAGGMELGTLKSARKEQFSFESKRARKQPAASLVESLRLDGVVVVDYLELVCRHKPI